MTTNLLRFWLFLSFFFFTFYEPLLSLYEIGTLRWYVFRRTRGRWVRWKRFENNKLPFGSYDNDSRTKQKRNNIIAERVPIKRRDCSMDSGDWCSAQRTRVLRRCTRRALAMWRAARGRVSPARTLWRTRASNRFGWCERRKAKKTKN